MTITCIIPFFNEKNRILKVVDEIVKIKEIDQLLLVDDGSSDGTTEQVKKHFPNLTIIHNSKNLGKTEAVILGLKKAKGDYILLLDADLKHLHHQEIENALTVVKSNSDIDMIIFNRINSSLFIRTLRGAILTSGQRILKQEDLLQALSHYKPKGYQLELALNEYMMDKHKNSYWMPISAVNTPQTEKRGVNIGIQRIINIHIEMFGYLGFYNALKELLFFCKKEYKNGFNNID
jgi:glycosyltransferase involved in cell wall biosynthesis